MQDNSFFEKIFLQLPLELQEFFEPLFKYFIISPNLRIGFFLSGIIICLFLLYFSLKKKLPTIPKEQSFFDLITQYNFNYAHGELIRKILAPKKNYKFFLEDHNFFESQLEKYQEKQNFNAEAEIKISQIRKKLQFNTLNLAIRFYKTQQLHTGAILKISMNILEGNIQFDAKVLENYESYFLVSYPQINKEDYKLTVNQELSIAVNIHGVNYTFKTRPVIEEDKEQKGIKLIHTSNLKTK